MNNSNFQNGFNPEGGACVYTPAPPPQYFEKRAVRKTGNKIGAALLFFFGVTLIISFSIGIGTAILGKADLVSDPFLTLAINTVVSVMGFLGGGLLLIKITNERSRISFAAPEKGTLVPLILIGVGFCYAANIAVSIMQASLSFLGELKGGDFETPRGLFGFIFTVISVAVFPALLEEFFFRGALLGSLLKFGKPFAIFTSAVLFGLIHGNLVQIPFAFLVGLVLGFAVVESGSIWTGIIIHFINNFLSVCFKYLSELGLGDGINLIFNIIILGAIGFGFLGVRLLTLKKGRLFDFAKTPHHSTAKQRFWWLMGSPTVIVATVFVLFEILLNQFSPAV